MSDDTPHLCPHSSARLRDSTPFHLHVTSRRVFVGPYPLNWTKRTETRSSLGRSERLREPELAFEAELNTGPLASGPLFPDLANTSPDEEAMDSESENSDEDDESHAIEDLEELAMVDPETSMEHESTEVPMATQELSRPGNSRLESGLSKESFVTANTQLPPSRFPSPLSSPLNFEDARQVFSSATARQESNSSSESNNTGSWSPPLDGLRTSSVETAGSSPPQFDSKRSNLSLPLDPREPESTGQGTDEGSQKELFNDNTLEKGAAMLRGAPMEQTLEGSGMKNIVRFHTDTTTAGLGSFIATKKKHFGDLRSRIPFRRRIDPGQLLYAERMLARFETSKPRPMPKDYDENKAYKVDRHVNQNWTEYIVVARAGLSDEQPLTLYFHRSRHIATTEHSTDSKRYSLKFPVELSNTSTNFYSSLDKTIVLWKEERKCNRILILRPKGSASSIRWYGFIQRLMGRTPDTAATIDVPDLDVRIRLSFESPQAEAHNTPNLNASGGIHVDPSGRIFVRGVELNERFLVESCWKLLRDSRDWHNVLSHWLATERMGLCWRKYDRIEWIHGDQGEKLVSQWTMSSTHHLEFRPKLHYPHKVILAPAKEMFEPPPIEGYLIQMVSMPAKGAVLKKAKTKRLYFSTHDHLLYYSKPKRARPPLPTQDVVEDVDNNQRGDCIDKIPLIFPVDPYAQENNDISWMRQGQTAATMIEKDRQAKDEESRKQNQISNSDGFVDLTKVARITCSEDVEPPEMTTKKRRDSVNAVQRHLCNDQRCCGAYNELNRFELVMMNGTIVRLKAHSEVTRQEWVTRLGALCEYWKRRVRADMHETMETKKKNMDVLRADDRLESMLGTCGSKWAVKRCVANASLFNFCVVSGCRTIVMRGYLFRKHRARSAFRLFYAVLTQRQLILYDCFPRSMFGGSRPSAVQKRHQTLELKDSYLYSGSVTDELLHARKQAFDADAPGHHTIPRLYADGLTSVEEDENLAMVLWTGRRKAVIADEQRFDVPSRKAKTHLRSISRLGVIGRSVIFMARSRQERDMWIQAMGTCIERLVEDDHIKFTDH